MSGHSKWSTIKRKKGKADAARGNVFTKIGREITMAARDGGGDPEKNPRLRTAMVSARAANMPADNVKRAIQRGTGELPGVSYDEATYEAYGPGGVALLIECLTDNKNRCVAEIRHILSKNNGNMGEAGSVAWMFDARGLIQVDAGSVDEDGLIEAALEAGAADVSRDGDVFEVICEPSDFETVKEGLTSAGIAVGEAAVTKVPQNTIALDQKQAQQMLRLMEVLEEHDDVQDVSANFDIPDEVMERFGGGE